MAKGIKASGKMSVGRFEKEFEDVFGVRIEVKVKKRLADNNATLASLRPKDYSGAKSADFKVFGNMLVRNVKKNITKTFGVKVDLYHGGRIAPDNITLSDLRLGKVKKEKAVKATTETSGKDKTAEVAKPALTEKQIAKFKKREKEDVYLDIMFIVDDGISLAEDIYEAGDEDWARKIYSDAEKDEDLTVDDCCSLATSICNTIEDKNWARKLYVRAEGISEDQYDYVDVVDGVLDYLNDKKWGKTLCEKLEQIADDLDAEDSVDIFGALGNAACAYFDDKDWARDLYKKAEKLLSDVDETKQLAEYVASDEFLGDKDWARDLYKKAVELVEDNDDYEDLADSIEDEDNLGDEDWAGEIRKKA